MSADMHILTDMHASRCAVIKIYIHLDIHADIRP